MDGACGTDLMKYQRSAAQQQQQERGREGRAVEESIQTIRAKKTLARRQETLMKKPDTEGRSLHH